VDLRVPDLGALSAREREVLVLLGEQLTHEQVGERLFISARTVESHVASLRRKLGMPDHRALVRFAVEQRWTPAGGVRPPAPLTSFVGRERELAGLVAMLGTARLISAVGPGGVGKTRLALAASAAAAPRFEDGVCWVDLAPVADAAGLEESVALACAAVPTSRLGLVEAVIVALRERRVLLVLDNCEHVANAVAVLAERLLISCRYLTVLATSRARLAVSFEQVFALSGLSTDADGDAVALFVERAAAAGSAAPTDAERERIRRVCEALDGLPLAVELAAVRLPSLGLDGIERGLLHQTDLLTAGARANPRHRSISDAMDWSLALLKPPAATALRRLAVLVTPFDTAAAAAVAAFAPITVGQLPAALEQLAEHNLLVTADIDGRRLHRMLEPVRQFGIARMTAGDEPAFALHLAWCRRVSETMLQASAFGHVRAIADDSRAALAWAAGHSRPDTAAAGLARGLGLLLFGSGSLREAQTRLEQAAGFTSDGTRAAADLALAAAVAKCRVRGEDALRLERAAAQQARTAGDLVAAALALARAGELLNRFPGMFDARTVLDAEPYLAEASALAPHNPHVAAALHVARAGYAAPGGAPGPERAQAALEAARAVGDPILESSALDALIAADIFRLDMITAHRLAMERVKRLRAMRTDDPPTGLELKDALHVAVFCALGLGDLDTALAMARAQHDLAFLRETRDVADDELMAPMALAGDLAAAVEAGEGFLADWTAAGKPPASGRALAPAAVALAHGLLGDHAARQRWLSVVAEFRGVPHADAARGTGYGELFEAMVLLRADRPHEAFDVLTAPGDRGMYGHVFHQWTTALTAEAAVRAGRPDARKWIRRAAAASTGNSIATAITHRAAELAR
jgi:predicted ATPase/DNA-binding CsgD family transcriptional regulator